MNNKLKQNENRNVAILGASDRADRYAYKAFKLLQEHGYNTFLVHPTLKVVEGQKVYANLSDINEAIDTITVYVNSNISSSMANQIIDQSPKRVIFNPGAENIDMAGKLMAKGIDSENACTLVLLSTNQF